jgi:hypothetical protein
MAQQMPMINVGGNNLPPEILQQQQALNRQQQMAQLLMQQGQSMPSGQMVSGRYVAPSFFQYAAPLFQSYAGQSLAKEGDKTALDLAKQLRQQYANEMAQFQDLYRGKEQTFEQAGPTQTGGNIPNQTYRTGADPQAAYLFGSTAYNPVLQQVSAKKMLEGPKYKEVTQYNQQTGNTEIYRYDENSQNPRDTMQFLGISKPAISPEAQIRFGDENINIPAQFRGGAVGQPTSAYGANVQFTPNQVVGAPQSQTLGQPQITPNVATVASTQIKDPFKAPPPPTTLASNKEIREWKLDQAKPLTGTPNDIVNGAKNYQKAIFKIQELFDQYTPEDLLKPNVRAIVKQAVENARLQGKEANKLGALTGPDYGILEKLVVDPTAFNTFLVDRNTINKIYNNERAFTSEIIKGTYETAQKPVPENLREFVEVKPKELATNKPKEGNADIQSQLRSKGIPYQPKLYEYRVNPDGSVDRKRKIL